MPPPPGSNRTEIPIALGGLANSSDITKVPDGKAWSMDSVDTSQNIVGIGPRYGAVNQRPGYNAGDVGWGVCYSSFGTSAEYVAIVQPNGSGTANAYAVNANTGVWTQLATGLNASNWYFRQYQDKVYCSNQATGIWMHTVGNLTANDDTLPSYLWKQFLPQFDYGGLLNLSTAKPPYTVRICNASDAVATVFDTQNDSYGSAIDAKSGDLLLTSSFRPNRPISAYGYNVLTLSANLDLSNVSYIYFEARMVSGNGTARMGAQGLHTTWGFGLAQDSAAITAAWAHATPLYGQSVETVGAEGNTIYVRVNVSNIPNASKNAVTRLVFLVPCAWGNGEGLQVHIANIQLGGALMWDIPSISPAPAISYAYAYYNPTTKTLQPAVRQDLGAGLLDGLTPGGGYTTLGAQVQLSPPANSTLFAQGFTQIYCFRLQKTISINAGGSSGAGVKGAVSRGSDGGGTLSGTGSTSSGGLVIVTPKWRLLGSVSNSGTPSFIDANAESNLINLTAYTLTFAYIPITMAPTNIGCWKGYFLMLIDRKLFASWGGEPNRFLPPPDQNYQPPNTDDLAQGRTLFISYDQSQNGLGVVEQNLLYICTPAGVYAMIGDTMEFATPARLLPVSRGTLGNRSMCAHRAGCLVAAEDGLWYYETTTLFNGVQDWTYTVEEITQAVRTSYQRLRQGGGSGMVVLSWQDEIWLWNSGRYMHLTKANPITGERTWEEGTFPTVVAVAPYPGRGILGQLADGSLALLHYTTAGVPYTSDNGTPKTWSATTGWMVQPRQRIVSIRALGAGTPSIQVSVDDGLRGITTSTFTKDQAGRSWLVNVVIRPGTQFQVTATGGAADTLIDLVLVAETETPGYGN